MKQYTLCIKASFQIWYKKLASICVHIKVIIKFGLNWGQKLLTPSNWLPIIGSKMILEATVWYYELCHYHHILLEIYEYNCIKF